MPTTPFTLTPDPLKGTGAFGLVPGTVGLPTPGADLNAAAGGGVPGLNKQMLDTLSAWGGGQLSPGTLNALQNAAATFGLTSGMPGGLRPGSLTSSNLFGNVVGFAENQAQKAMQDYNQLIPTISRTQTVDPALQARIAESNALSLAAPSPAAAASHAESLFNKYLNALRGGGGGGGGGAWGGFRPVGGGGSGTDFFGQPYGRSTGTEGTIVAGAGGILPGSSPAGAGGVLSGSTGDPWMDNFWQNFDVGTDVPPGSPGGGVPYTAGSNATGTTIPQMTGDESSYLD